MAADFNPLDHPILFATPRRLTQYSAWHGHIPFALLLVELAQPQLLVELGTYYGDSYCAFCQAVQELHLPTQCYGIDMWQGDPQTGMYGAEVLADLRAHHDRLYGGFSQLLQSTFDDAQPRFADGSIDVLHIDGYHTYEAVKHDFDCWLPKLSPRGVVLFHDICAREKDFSAWIFWNEVKSRYPFLEFFHGYGLGVLAVGTERPQTLLQLMGSSGQDLVKLRVLFFQLGFSCSQKAELERLKAQLPEKEGTLQRLRERLTEIEDAAQEKELTYQRQIASLEQTVEEQTKHLDALCQAMSSMTGRVAELHKLLIDSQQQLVAQTEEIERFRTREAQLGAQAHLNQEQIRRMMATRVWKIGEVYWRALEGVRSLFGS